jgi:GntR family transcriptional regulator
MAIADGRLEPGTKLPTVRGLAVELEINPNTVARAYNELEIRGIVSTQQGSGTFVRENQEGLSDEERREVLEKLVRDFLSTAASYGFSPDEVAEEVSGARSAAESPITQEAHNE